MGTFFFVSRKKVLVLSAKPISMLRS